MIFPFSPTNRHHPLHETCLVLDQRELKISQDTVVRIGHREDDCTIGHTRRGDRKRRSYRGGRVWDVQQLPRCESELATVHRFRGCKEGSQHCDNSHCLLVSG
eukprot:CAMPEP_0205851000 /NCGR_PEP_ID=MMETSP1083-20121108/257_1 /ASSEMBLY_ACC=CAM_ASM_000430 /TAXON_ID=97485 /ORGANISM="Prymnesium parvum, Strain Texoma1" /LENGTH=102 /DNA_ID=CAMNT_0053212117 /DNA_START=1117 /DNA_END=1421 /DNA_ORIENTATION=+